MGFKTRRIIPAIRRGKYRNGEEIMLAQRPKVWLAAAAIALWLTLAAAITSHAAETTAAGAGSAETIELARPAELDGVSLTVIDRKLALSLAVEIYLQVALIDDVIDRIQDPDLKRLTERKLQLYRGMFVAFDRLVQGRAMKILTDGGHQVLLPGASGNAGESVDKDQSMPCGLVAGPAREQSKRDAHGEQPSGGLRYVLSQISEIAILQARIEISNQYQDIWHAELEPVPAGDFDRRYLSTDSVNQMQVVGMLRACERRASSDFARIIHRATASAEDQLAQCMRIARRIEETRFDHPNTAVRVTVPE